MNDILIVGLLVCFVVILLDKWGVFEYYETRRPPKWPERICLFCLGFWLSLLFTLLLFPEFWYIKAPAASVAAVVIRKLL